MPKVIANSITMNYDQQGTGEPLILIPYLAADYACYAFQVAEYAKHFTCISVDLRGTGESDRPAGVYSTELFADDVPHSCRPWESTRPISLACRWALPPACGWPPNTRRGSSPCHCIAAGPR